MMKKIFWQIEDFIWTIKCWYNFWLHGSYGLTRTIEQIPFKYLLKFLRRYGATIGSGVILDSGFKIHRPDAKKPLKNLFIGQNVYIGHRILLDLTDRIIFEDDTAIGADCQIWTHVGDYQNKLRDKADYTEKIAPVVLHIGALVYSNVVLNPGAEVGKNSRVYAMSMVSNSIPDVQVWAGIPAKFLSNRQLKSIQQIS